MDNNTHFQIQSYDTDWDAYVDVEDFSALADKSKLRCTNLTMTVPPVQSSSVSGPEVKLEANQVEGANSWPIHFEFPVDKLPVQVQQALQNKVNLLHPKNRYVRGLLLQTLCMEAVKMKSHPDHGQKIDMARSIILQWPYLKEQVGRGYDGWLSSIVDGLKSARRSVGLIDTARSDAIMKRRMIASHHGTPGDLFNDDVILVQNISSSDSELSACSMERRQTPGQVSSHGQASSASSTSLDPNTAVPAIVMSQSDASASVSAPQVMDTSPSVHVITHELPSSLCALPDFQMTASTKFASEPHQTPGQVSSHGQASSASSTSLDPNTAVPAIVMSQSDASASGDCLTVSMPAVSLPSSVRCESDETVVLKPPVKKEA